MILTEGSLMENENARLRQMYVVQCVVFGFFTGYTAQSIHSAVFSVAILATISAFFSGVMHRNAYNNLGPGLSWWYLGNIVLFVFAAVTGFILSLNLTLGFSEETILNHMPFLMLTIGIIGVAVGQIARVSEFKWHDKIRKPAGISLAGFYLVW